MATKKDEYSYFKVNERILDIDIKKSELWVYLTHCRTRGTKSIGYKVRGSKVSDKKTVIYSTASLTGVQKLFGSKIKQRAYDKAIESLEEKGLIYAIDIDKTGVNRRWFKSKKAIEIVEPKDTVNIQIPSELLDKKIMADMTVEEIKTVIELYKNYNFNDNGMGAISTDCIIAYNTNNKIGYYPLGSRFGQKFNRSIYHKDIIVVDDFNYIDTDINIDILERLVDKGLFRFKPVVMEFDLEDKDLFELKYELFKNVTSLSDDLTKGKEYIIAELEEDKAIVWVLEPIYRVDIEPTRKYLENHSRAYERALLIYSKTDDLTDRKHTRYALYHDETYERAEILLESNIFDEVLELKEQLYQETEEQPLYLLFLEERLKSLEIQKAEEEQAIEDENERLRVEEDYRSRKTTTPRLKAIEKDIKYINSYIAAKEPIIDNLENRLLDLIPTKAIELFFIESGYESENVGKASRFIS